MIDVDGDTLKALASYTVARAEPSFELATADAYVFGDNEGKLRSPDAMTSRWDRRRKWLAQVHPTMQKAAADCFAVHLGGAQHTSQHIARK